MIKKCEKCEGEGFLNYICAVCDGTGIFGYGTLDEKTCESCKGKGTIRDICYVCWGTGYVEKEEYKGGTYEDNRD